MGEREREREDSLTSPVDFSRTNTQANKQANKQENKQMNNHDRQLHIVFLHLDLGIGGAEQLIINLALASSSLSSCSSSFFKTKSSSNNSTRSNNSNSTDNDQRNTQETKTGPSSLLLNAKVSIFTTHCDQNHCFDAVQKKSDPPGILASCVHVVGSFLPVHFFGKGTAFCSTLRMFYLSIVAKRMYPHADVIVLDGLPSPIPYLVSQKTSQCVIYYCHFPDKLLTRDTVNGELFILGNNNGDGISSSTSRLGLVTFVKNVGQWILLRLKNHYRKILDRMEEWAISYADLVCVNSEFTRKQVLHVFPSLEEDFNEKDKMKVLHPAIDLNKFVLPDFDAKQEILSKGGQYGFFMPIVSLNRFERKKNIEVLLHAYASIQKDKLEHDNGISCNNTTRTYSRSGKNKHQSTGTQHNHPPSRLPPLIIAGGYDVRNKENVEYLKELQCLANNLGIQDQTVFKPSVSDEERAMLLKSALCVVYTPHREHFGIVPLEAMYAGSAVVAMKSGGPEETVKDGITGILVDMTPKDTCEKLANAIRSLLEDPKIAIDMGKCGHEHVKKHFGLDPFRQEWSRLVLQEAVPRGKERLRNAHDSTRTTTTSTVIWWCLCLLVVFCACWIRWYTTS
jgi:Glycosyltransferase